jgi:methyl-accepting chemotaxis protein
MKYITNNDQELLFESYSSINAKQIILESSLNNFLYNDQPITTLSEAYAMLDIYNDLVEENIFAGLGALAGTAGRGLAAAGQKVAQGAQAVGQKVAQGAQAVGRGVAQGAQAAGQKVAQGAQAVGRGVSEVGSNISNIYGTASSAADAAKVVTTANQAANQLKEVLSAAVAQNPEIFKGGALGSGGDPGNQRLNDVINHLAKVQQSLSQQSTQAQQRGFFGGVGTAMRGQQSGGATPAGAPATP